MQSVWFAFLTGLTTGGLSCLAIQGGLLASSIASIHREGDTEGESRQPPSFASNWRYVGMFLVAKLAAYTVLGYFLGLLGSTLTLSPKVLGGVQIMVGLFMLATAARLLDLHPVFRYFVIQPPRWVYRMLKNKSRDASLFAPAILGVLTILMPCGITQATMAVAIASGKPLMGAAIMFAFVLGTSPIFFALGASIVELLQRKAFVYVAAFVVFIFAVLSINGGLGLQGSFYTIGNLYKAATMNPDSLAGGSTHSAAIDTQGVQQVTINVASNGYTASAQTLRKNVPVQLTLKTNNTGGCARAFTIPDLNISKILPESGTETIEFTPKKEGRLAYACSMGMYTGSFTVIP
jgi:uncharacterized protein